VHQLVNKKNLDKSKLMLLTFTCIYLLTGRCRNRRDQNIFWYSDKKPQCSSVSPFTRCDSWGCNRYLQWEQSRLCSASLCYILYRCCMCATESKLHHSWVITRLFTGDWSCEDGVFVQHLRDCASLVAVTDHINPWCCGQRQSLRRWIWTVFNTRLIG
jgi:hypothetical protein